MKTFNNSDLSITQIFIRIILVISLVSCVEKKGKRSQKFSPKTITSHAPMGSPGEDFPKATNDGNWVTTNSPRAIYYKGKYSKTYSGWIERNGSIVIWSYDHESGKEETFTLHKNFHSDTHDNPAVHVRKDGRIQAFYTQHGKENFIRSFVSTNPEDISKWDSVNHIQTIEGATYTLVFRLEGENDRTYLFTRALEWHPTVLRSDDDGNTWSTPIQLIGGGGDRPYQRMVSDGKSKIHIAFTTGHPRKEPSNSVYYFYYEKGGFYKADGTFIKSWNDLPVLPSEADLVYDGSTKGRAWTWDLAIGLDGYPVIAHGVYPEENDHRYYYARWTGAEWFDKEITKAGRWFPETPEGTIEPEPHYSPGYSLDHHDPSIVYLSRHIDEASGPIEVERWLTRDKGISWTSKSITSGSQFLNGNPIGNWAFPYGSRPDQKMVLWMNGKYRHYTDYNTSIRYWLEPPGIDDSK